MNVPRELSTRLIAYNILRLNKLASFEQQNRTHSYTVYQHNLRDISARLTSSDRGVDSDDSDDEAEERYQQTFTYVIPRLNVIFDSIHAIFQDPAVLLALDHSRIRTSPWYVFLGMRRGCNGSEEGHLAKPCPSLCRLQNGTILAEN